MSALEIAGLRRVHQRGRGDPPEALRGIDLDLPEGEAHGLLGPNGAGKTTLCKIVSTVLASVGLMLLAAACWLSLALVSFRQVFARARTGNGVLG